MDVWGLSHPTCRKFYKTDWSDIGKCVPDITRATKILKYHQQPTHLKYNKNKASYKSVACFGRMLKLGRIMYLKGKTKSSQGLRFCFVD